MSEGEKDTSLSDDIDEGNDDNELEEMLDEVLDKIPQEHRKTVERMIVSQSVQMRGIISPETTVMNKITSEHITNFLAASQEEMKYSFEEKKHRKLFTFATVVISMVFIIMIIILLRDTPDIMEKIIYAAGGVVAGAFGGYGFGKNKRDE